MENNNGKNKRSIVSSIIWITGGYLLLVILISVCIYWLGSCTSGSGEKPNIYHNIAIAVIIAWVLYLIGYYVWAIYFYNINQGWTDDDWDRFEKNDMPALSNEQEPEGNPNQGESLGLPPGTVRATLALSLLVAGLAMLIVSFSMNSTYPPSQVFVDNLEFIKTGFLMMIAFYFGAKSLDILRKTNMSATVSQPQQPQTGQQAEKEKPKEIVPTDPNAAG
jgi:magnesium-transporting ATPase (P-type)